MDSSTRTVNKNTTSATPMLSHHWRYNSRYAGLFLTFITAALLFLCPSKSLGKIVSVAMLSRHGTRAANEVLMNSCPNYRPNFDSYLQLMHIQPGGLTPKGMQTLYDLGEFTRKRYIEKTQLLEERYTSVDIRVQAVDAERTLQSAEIWGDAMYPQNSGSPLYARVSIDPTPLPIYVTPDDLDDVLEPRKATCAAQINHDTRMWDAEVGINIVKQHHALVDKLGEVCGANLTALYPYAAFGQPAYNLGDAIKDISDALTFDYDQLTNPLPKVSDVISVLNGVDPEMFFQTRRLAIELLYGRLYATEEIVNYMSGELPAIIRDQIRGMMDWHTQHEQYKHDSAVYDQQYALYQRQCEEYKRQLQSESNQHRRQNLDIPINDKMDSDGTSDPSQLSSLPPSPPTLPHRPVIEMPKKMLAFHGHREILYAMAKFQGMDFNISWPGLPTRAIPAATTMFWELHTVEGDAGDGHSNENTGNDPGGNQYYSNGLFKPPTYVIRTFHWVPISEIKHMNRSASLVHSPDSQVGDWQDGVSGDEINEGLERDLKRDGFKQIKLGFCSAMDCPVEEFLAYIQDRFDQYGTLQTLCTKGKVQDNQHMHPSHWMGDDTVERGYAEVPATHDRHTSSSTSAPSPSPSATDTPTTSVSTADTTSAETSVASNTIATADGSGAMSADEDATVYARRVLMSPSSALPRRLSPNRPHALSSGPADDYAIFIGACIVLVLTIVMSYISYAITTSTRRRGYASIQRESDATV